MSRNWSSVQKPVRHQSQTSQRRISAHWLPVCSLIFSCPCLNPQTFRTIRNQLHTSQSVSRSGSDPGLIRRNVRILLGIQFNADELFQGIKSGTLIIRRHFCSNPKRKKTRELKKNEGDKDVRTATFKNNPRNT